MLADIWPTEHEVARRRSRRRCSPTCSARSYGEVFEGDERWQRARDARAATRFAWDDDSTYVRNPPYFEGMQREPAPLTDIEGARVLAMLGDSVTTDHISPAGAIKEDSPGGRLPQGARRREARLQLLRLAARQPRGDDARHVRQHPPAQPARAGHRGRRHASDGRRAAVDLRRGDGLHRGGHAAGRPRRQGVRLGLVARLGGEGHERCSASAR